MTNSNSSISRHYHQLNSEQRGQIQALRKFFPKGKSMKDKTAAYVQQATNAIYHKHCPQQKNSSSNISFHNLTVALKLKIQVFMALFNFSTKFGY